MGNRLFIIFLALFFFGCSTNAYNIPFVDSVETVTLTAGMSRSEVLGVMGQPLYSEYGNRESGEIFWVYEVRGREVKSDILAGSGPSMDNVMEAIPNKTHSIVRPTPPIHRLRLEFRNDKLYRWMPVAGLNNDEGTEEEQQEETTQSSSSSDAPKDTIYVLVVKETESNERDSKSTSSSAKENTISKKQENSNFSKTFIQAGFNNVVSELSLTAYSLQAKGSGVYYNDIDCQSCYYQKSPSLTLFIGRESSRGRFGLDAGFGSSFHLGVKRELLNVTPALLNINFGFVFRGVIKDLQANELDIDNISDYTDLQGSSVELDPDSGSIEITGLSLFQLGIGKDIAFNGHIITPRYELSVGPNLMHIWSLTYQLR